MKHNKWSYSKFWDNSIIIQNLHFAIKKQTTLIILNLHSSLKNRTSLLVF
jgi:hypothetical protein